MRDVEGITTLAERRLRILKFKVGSSDAAILKDLLEDCQQLILCFIAYVEMKLDDSIMVHDN